MSEALVALAVLFAVAGFVIYGVHPAHKSPELGLVMIAVAAVFSIGAGAWAISEQSRN